MEKSEITKTRDPIKIRGHHISWLYIFLHEGKERYQKRVEWQGKEFAKNASNLLSKLFENQNLKILLVVGPDGICDICPPSTDTYRRTCENPPPPGFCEKYGVSTMEEYADQFALKVLGLVENGVYKVSDVLNAVESFVSKHRCYPT